MYTNGKYGHCLPFNSGPAIVYYHIVLGPSPLNRQNPPKYFTTQHPSGNVFFKYIPHITINCLTNLFFGRLTPEL